MEALIVILCTLVAFAISLYTDKTYYTVNQSLMLRTSINSSLGNASQSSNVSHGQLYMPMIKDSITNPEAIKEANRIYAEKYPDATDKIEAQNIEITYKEKSLIFNFSYTDLNEDVAKNKMAIIYQVANEQLDKDIKSDDVRLIPTDGIDEDGNVRYYSVVTSDSTTENTLLGGAIGVVVAVAVVFIKYIMDNTVREKDEFEELTGISVLSFIEKEPSAK